MCAPATNCWRWREMPSEIDLAALGYQLVSDVHGARPFWRIVHDAGPRKRIIAKKYEPRQNRKIEK